MQRRKVARIWIFNIFRQGLAVTFDENYVVILDYIREAVIYSGSGLPEGRGRGSIGWIPHKAGDLSKLPKN